MESQYLVSWKRFASAALVFGVMAIGTAFGADIPTDSLKIAAGVTKAMEGYETTGAKYIVANPTNIFSDHFYYNTKVMGELKRGEPVQALAKVKAYDWVLVGKNGTGIGYVPISMLAPENEYHSS